MVQPISKPLVSSSQTPLTANPVQSSSNHFSALYLFAGTKRKSDIASFLKRFGWTIDELDILRSKKHDLTKEKLRSDLLGRITSGKYTAILASPPCDTFTRVKFANKFGPRPTRSFTHPRGFNWLTGDARRQVQLANTLADFTFSATHAQAQTSPGLVVLEFPEDFGAVATGDWKGVRPSSIWQWPQFANLLADPSFSTVGIRQQDFGIPYV